MIMAYSRKSLIGKIFKRIGFLFKKEKSWEDIEYFHEAWKERIRRMAIFIQPGQSVIDLGCGMMWLQLYLPEGCQYIPVDYRDRGNNSLVADFNKKQFPPVETDVAFISGCLEYVKDPQWFLDQVCHKTKNRIILSYCTTEKVTDREERNGLHWVNHLSYSSVRELLVKGGFSEHTVTEFQQNTIFVFDRCKK
jgi:hypothetical protein